MDQNKGGMMGKQLRSQNEEGNKAAKPGWKEAWSKWKVWQSSSGAISPQILSTVLRDQKHGWKIGICVTSLTWEAVHLSSLYFKFCCPFLGRHHYSPPLAFSSANNPNPIIHQCRRHSVAYGALNAEDNLFALEWLWGLMQFPWFCDPSDTAFPWA